MSAAGIQSAMDTHLSAIAGLPAVAWPGVSYTPAIGTPYVAPSMSGLDQVPVAAGADGVIRWNGTYQVSVMWSSLSAEGTAAAYAIADTIRAEFKRGLNLVTSDSMKIIVRNTAIKSPLINMPWVHVPVVVSFWADEYP